jgi:hypothetical protein
VWGGVVLCSAKKMPGEGYKILTVKVNKFLLYNIVKSNFFCR